MFVSNLTCMRTLSIILIALMAVACDQQTQNVTLADYQRAESFLSANTSSLVFNTASNYSWNNTHLIYKQTAKSGAEYLKLNLETGEVSSAFDVKALATLLSEESGEEQDADDLNVNDVEFQDGGMTFRIGRAYYTANLDEGSISKTPSPSRANEILSPDKSKAAFIKDFNLWVRDTKTDQETQLTFDGIEDYGYATNNAGWIRRDSPVLLWSPQSDKIATFRHDGRGVGEMYLWSTKVGHPDLEQWKYPLPGDSLIFRIERNVIHLGPRPRMVTLKMAPDDHRSTISDHIAGRGGTFLDVEWSADGSSLAFVSSSRDHKSATLRLADPETGDVRTVLNETVDTYFESGEDRVNWHVLHKSGQVLWFSERTDWGHLYMYDLDGNLKHTVTEGAWRVMQVHHIDEDNEKIYFIGTNKEEGDPYFWYLYSVNFDGSELTNLTPENAHHSISWSPDFQYFIDSYSTPNTPPVTVVRALDGSIIATLGEADISELIASGWVAPEPFVVKARDEQTDIYGLMYKPSNFDPSKSYPILNYLYPGPQSGSVGSRSFRSSRGDKQAVAELGFIVVELDAMGTPGRSKSFHDAYYGNMGDNGLPDQIAGIKQLAAKNTWMDIDRVGIWGHSGGGFASTAGILRYPEFYKVAVSGAGNHDNRNYEDDWGEKWHGLLVKNDAPETQVDLEIQEQQERDNYDKQANQLLAPNLQGKLLIAHGMMDANVHPSNTLLVADALIKADKDFDMVVFPNARHGFGNSRYFMRKRWDYFVRHLIGTEPPKGFLFADNIR